MSYIKIKGSGWCERCGCERSAFFTRLVQCNDKQEVQGTCSSCDHIIRREFLSPAFTVPEPIPTAPELAVETEEKENVIHKKKPPVSSNNRPALLGILLAACCMLWVDQYLF